MEGAPGKVARWCGIFLAFSALLSTQFVAPTQAARVAAPAAPSGSGAGLLDPAYGPGGKVRFEQREPLADYPALAVAADGELITASASNGWVLLRAFKPDGSPDTAFGNAGQLYFGDGGMSVSGSGLAIQPDGKIVLAAAERSDRYYSHTLVVRFNRNGSRDESFGDGGILRHNGVVRDLVRSSVLVQPDGKLLVSSASVLRVNADGTLDADFDYHDGAVATLALLPGGKFLASADNILTRYNSDGSKDYEWASSSRVFYREHPLGDDVRLAVSGDGKITITGKLNDNVALLRWNADGTADLSFGGSGFVSSDLGGVDQGRDLLLLPDGGTIVATSSSGALALLRYEPDGTLDPSFGNAGKLVIRFSGDATGSSLQRDGAKLALAGTADLSVVLERYSLSGALDTTFGGGKVEFAMPTFYGADWRVAAQANGGVVIARIDLDHFHVERFDSSSQRDRGFAGSGEQVIDALTPDNYNNPVPVPGTLTGIVTQTDGRIIVLGDAHDLEQSTSYYEEFGNLVLWRDQPDGELLDLDYGRLAGIHAAAGAFGVQPNGKILVAGRAFVHWCTNGPVNPTCQDIETFAIARYNDGGHDSSFPDFIDEDMGRVQLMTGQYDDKPLVMIDGRIRRYNTGAANQLDTTFGAAGYLDPAVPVRALTPLPDGKLLTAGSDGDFVLARFMPDGSRDASFGAAGISRVHFAGTDVVNAVTLQPDGKIVLAGERSGDFVLARFMPDGGLDPAFGNAGVVSTDLGGGDRATAVAIRDDGKILVAGTSDGRPAAALYLGDACNPDFTDVSAGAYYEQPVRALYCRGDISGYADGTFRPANTTSRGQLAKIVTLAAGLKLANPASATFTDVAVGSPFFSYVETAAHAGLISGYADGTFRPNNNISRAQLAKIVTLAANWPLLTPPQPTFSDVGAANPFYSYIETAYSNRALSGYDLPDGGREFRWGAAATRGQVAKIVSNALLSGAPSTVATNGEK